MNLKLHITKIIGNITKTIGDYMFEYLFGNAVIEKILFFLLKNEKTYPTALSKVLKVPLFSCQMAFERLEKGGIVISILEGRTRIYQLNPRYPLRKELIRFLEKAYSFLPEEVQKKYYEIPIRTRPRRKGKPLND